MTWGDTTEKHSVQLQCRDGKLAFNERFYLSDRRLRHFIDSRKEWCNSHAKNEVMAELKKLFTESPGDDIVLTCCDGNLEYPRSKYDESAKVRELVDQSKDWIATHTSREVSDELEGRYYWDNDHVDSKPNPQETSQDAPGDTPDTFSLVCKDGLLKYSVKAYLESAAVRDFIGSHPGWIASHSRKDVSDELEELYMK